LELLELRREVQRIAAVVARSGFSVPSGDLLSAELAEVFSGLIAAEVDAELAQDVVSRLRAGGTDASPAEVRPRLRAELASRFSTDAQLGLNSECPRTAALVGPPGAGKTATLAKLAFRYGLSARRPTLLVSVDSFRVAAGEQLRSYAAILGAPFLSLESMSALRQALEEHRHKDLILIDTPGYAAQDLDAAAELAGFLSSQPNLDVHLVLTASMKPADLSQAVNRFTPFRPRKLIFTRLDETASFGPIVSQAARTGWPVSFLAHGQQVPEDLEPATQEGILDLVLGNRPGP
jgi:flagellar biosynthesis protein FlhF